MVLTIHANSEHNFFRLTSNEMGNVLNYITALQEHSHNVVLANLNLENTVEKLLQRKNLE